MKLKQIIYALILILAVSAGMAYASSIEDGIKLFHQKNWTEAAKKFESALVENPYDTLAILYVLDSYEKNGDLLTISNKFEQESVNNSSDAVAAAKLGFAYFSRSLLNQSLETEALEQFKKSIKADPKLGMAYTGLGLIYYQKRMMPRAKGYFLKAMQLNPNDLVANEFIGNILLVDEKKPDEALIYFKKINELLPSYPDAYYYIGSALYDLANYPEAIKFLQQSCVLDPQGVTQGYYAPQLIGDIYLKQKMYKEAASYFEQALKINPQNAYAKYKLEKARNQGK